MREETKYDGQTAKEWAEAWDRENERWQAICRHHEELEDAVKAMLKEGLKPAEYLEAMAKVKAILAQEGDMVDELRAWRQAQPQPGEVERLRGALERITKFHVFMDGERMLTSASTVAIAQAALSPRPRPPLRRRTRCSIGRSQ